MGEGLVYLRSRSLRHAVCCALILLSCPPPPHRLVPSPLLLLCCPHRPPPGEHAYKCSWCSFSTMTISQLKEHSLKVHGKALTLPRPRIVSLLSSHAHHSSQKATPSEEVEDSNGKIGLPSQIGHLGWRWAGVAGQSFFLEENLNANMMVQVKEET